MKNKLISIAIATLSLIGITTAIHSKADIKVEETNFSVIADRTNKPSAYCRNSDGSLIDENYSNSGNFCICCCAKGNTTIMSFDNDFAYCIGKHWQDAPTALTQVDKNFDIPLDQPEYASIFSIAAAGASSGTSLYGLNSTDLYYVTQCAIRSSLYGIPAENLAFYDENGIYNENMTAEFIRLRQTESEIIIPDEKIIEINTEFSDTTQVMIDNHLYYCYGPFFPEVYDTNFEEYYVNFTSEEQYSFISDTRNAYQTDNINQFPSDIPFFIYADALYQDDISVNINTNVFTTYYEPLIYVAHDKTYQDIAQIHITQKPTLISTELSVKNNETVGNLLINKKFIDDCIEVSDTFLISQPRFSIRHISGKYIVGTLINGHIVFNRFSDEPTEFSLNFDSTLFIENLPAGEYYICEVEGADEYIAEIPELLIENNSEDNIVDFINKKERPEITTTICTTTSYEMEITTTEDIEITEITTSTNYITTEYLLTESTPEETTFENIITQPVIVTEKITPSTSYKAPVQSTQYKRNISSSPHTGESGVTIFAAIFAMTASAVLALKFKK